MKLLFLDIDGVLNSEEYAIWCTENDEGKEYIKNGGDIFIDKKAVFRIKELCEKYNVRLVISSSWRIFTLETTKHEFERYKDLKLLNKYIVGITPNYINLDNIPRGKEIDDFLTIVLDKSAQISNIALYDIKFFNSDDLNIEYCIVDDDKDMLDKQMKNFVHIDNYIGITDNDIEKIKQILNIVHDKLNYNREQLR